MVKKSFNHHPDSYNEVSAKIILPYLFKTTSINSVLDVGCGLGTWLSVAKSYGVDDILGIDGDYVDTKKLFINSSDFISKDLNETFQLDRRFDLTICLEVAEHLSAESSEKLVDSLVSHSDLILFSAAVPFQGGENHINEQFPDYWQRKFADKGFKFYDVFRFEFWDNPEVNFWYKQNMFLVARENMVPASMQQHLCEKINLYIHPELFYRKCNNLDEIMTGRQSLAFYIKLLVKKLFGINRRIA
jgi:SAM-dependent methyltransferase